MVIVSWQRDIALNMENAKTIEISERKIYDDTHYIIYSVIATMEDDTKVLLGNYKDKERAKEIITNIVSLHSTFEVYKHASYEVQTQIAIQLYNQGIALDVYEIPLT